MNARKSMLAFANMAVGVLLGLVATKLIAVYMGTDPLGQVAGALGFLGIVFFVTDLGMGSAHIKRVSEGRDAGDCFATFAVFKIVATSVFVLLALGILFVYTVVLGKPLVSTTLPIFYAVLTYYVAKSLQEIGQSSFDARLETARSQFATFMDTLVRVAISIVAALAVGAIVHHAQPLSSWLPRENPVLQWMAREPGLALAVAQAAGGIAAAIASLWMLRRALERGRFRWSLLKDYATFALPLFITSAIGMIAQNVDTAALALFLDETQTGLFAGVRRVSMVLGGISTAVGVLLFPTISALAAKGDREAISGSMDRAIRYLSMLLMPITAFTIFFADDIIRLILANEFRGGATTLSVLALYTLLITLANPHANLLIGTDQPKVAARIGAVTALSIIVLDLVLIPNDIRSLGIPLAGMGVLGAAVGTLISGMLWYGLLRYATYRTVGYVEKAHVWKHALAALAMASVLLLFAQVMPLERFFHVPIYGALGLLVYLLALILVREFTRDDWTYVMDALNPREMARYVKTEILQRRR